MGAAVAAKRRRKSIHKLRSSFVATFSTLAAGLSGCGVAEQPPSRVMEEVTTGGSGGYDGSAGNPPGFAGNGGMGGFGGTAGMIAGAGGTFAGGGGFGANPPAPDTLCPVDPPAEGSWCSGSSSCSYHWAGGPTFDPCTGKHPTNAYCVNNAWVVEREYWTCNPPEPHFDAGIDEDAGQD